MVSNLYVASEKISNSKGFYLGIFQKHCSKNSSFIVSTISLLANCFL